MASTKRSKIVDDLIKAALGAALELPVRALSGKRMLLVDDVPVNLDRLSSLLREVGGDTMVLSSARTPAAALDICRAQAGRFDAVILNYRLELGETGIALLAQLHRAGLAADAKAVLYSSSMNLPLRRRARKAGFDDTIHLYDMDAVSLAMLLSRLLAATSTPENPD